MMSRNITFSLPVELIQRAKIYTAERGTTVNALVRELLQNEVDAQDRTRAAAERLLALAERGPYFSADPGAIRREDLHQRG